MDQTSFPVDTAWIRAQTDRPIVLVGMMAAGKSHLGHLLAEKLALPFIDTDKQIEAQAGQTIAGIFSSAGENVFRTMEASVVEAALRDKMPAVIATGGGAILNPDSAGLIFGDTVSVWVRATPQTILKRVGSSTDRPLLRNGNSQKVLEDLAIVRDPIYARAHIAIDTDDSTPRWMLNDLLTRLDSYYRTRT